MLPVTAPSGATCHYNVFKLLLYLVHVSPRGEHLLPPIVSSYKRFNRNASFQNYVIKAVLSGERNRRTRADYER